MAAMFVFDTSYDPMHLQVIPGHFTFAEADAHFSEVERYYTRESASNAPAALLADVRALSAADARSRKRVADAFLRLSPVMERRAVGHAIVMSSPLIRGALTAIFWIKQPSWQIRTFAEITEADAWLRRMFEEQGRATPSAPPHWWEGAAWRSG